MKRRDVELFNLSFLDILAGALGAVLFLFIVVPKGEAKGPEAQPMLALNFDTIQNTFFGELPDSLMMSQAGDTLLAVVINFDRMPSAEDCPDPAPCQKCPDITKLNRYTKNLENQLNKMKVEANKKRPQTNLKIDKNITQVRVASKAKVNTPPVKVAEKQTTTSKYEGDLPSVPCKFSVEINWEDIADNVDLFLCKDGRCVYGGRKKNKRIGFWDSGKSKTSIFGGDLRTTQEAVRQFDEIIEGDYKIYAQYKDAEENPKPSIQIKGLVYTKTKEKGQQAKQFSQILSFNNKERTLLGNLKMNADGSFNFIKTN